MELTTVLGIGYIVVLFTTIDLLTKYDWDRAQGPATVAVMYLLHIPLLLLLSGIMYAGIIIAVFVVLGSVISLEMLPDLFTVTLKVVAGVYALLMGFGNAVKIIRGFRTSRHKNN